MAYRGDIDGLRAVAVLSVVLFHFDYLDGGFVGVDIFFVISGFLITKIINDAVSADTFSIADFYVSRIRRIFPALFAVYAATLIFAAFYCFSFEADFIGKALLSSVFFVSNIFFLRQSGYFAENGTVNPLLHTWSLSVEEQFYIFLPVLMIALSTLALRMRHAILAAAALASFIAACYMVYADQSSAFYLMQYRGWELLLGSLLAVGAVPAMKNRRLADYTGAAGLALIVASVAVMSRKLPFPGHGALTACLGAALIIHSGAGWQTRTSRFLSIPPMRFIGLISYSLYLWHIPVRIIYAHLWGKAGDEMRLLLILLSVALATLSWRLIERPFRRHGPDGQGDRLAVLGTAAASVAILAFASTQIGTAVLILRQEPPEVAALLSHLKDGDDQSFRQGTCYLLSSSDDLSAFQASKCLEISPSKQDFLIIGDSHAAHLWPGLTQVFPQINFIQANASGCRPFLMANSRSRCEKLVDYIFTQFLPGKRLDGIILASRWRKDDIEKIKQTALHLRQFADRVIVFGPIVEYAMPLPRILALEHAKLSNRAAASYRKTYQKELDLELGPRMRTAGIEYISVYRAICTPECSVWAEQDVVPLQFDYGHLTTAGSKELARRIKGQLFPDVALQGEVRAAE